MTISNDVFILIKSLTKKERTYVRKCLGTTENDTPIYEKLFDLISEQEEYDEAEIKKKLRYTKSNIAFSALKNYLYEFIIDKVIYINRHSNRILDSNNTLQELNILYHKELFTAFFKRWKKASKIAHDYEDYAMILALKDQMSNLRIRQIIKTDEEDFKKIHEEEVYILQHFGEMQLLKSLYNRLILLFNKTETIKTEQDKNSLNDIKSNNILHKLPGNKSSFRYIYFYFMCRGIILFLENSIEAAYNEFMQLRPYMEKKKELISTKFILMYDYVEIAYPTFAYLNKFKNFFSLFDLPFVKKMKEQNEDSFLSNFIKLAQLKAAHANHDDVKIEQTRKQLAHLVELKHKIKHVHLERNIICYLSISFFISANYQEAFYWGKQYFAIGAKHKKEDQFDFFHLFIVLVAFELGNYTILVSEANNSYQYFYRHKKLNPLEINILKTVKKITHAAYNKEKKGLYEGLKYMLENIPEQEKNVSGFRYFNFYSWVCSKINNTPYVDFMLTQPLETAIIGE